MNRVTSQTARYWLLWSFGVALFPIAAAFVLPDGLPFPHSADFVRGVGIWSAWAAGFGTMAFAMSRLRRQSVRALVIAQLVAGLAFAFAHAMPSIDTYAYLGYGDQLLHGADPWSAGPLAAYDEITRDFTAVWGQSPPSCRYGPGFVLFEAAMMRAFDGSSVATLVVVQRLISLLAAAGITMLVRGPNARFWALNPFVFYYYVLEAHNDVLFLLALAAAARISRPILQGALVGFAGAIKIVALAVFATHKPTRASMLSISSATVLLVALYTFEPLARNGDGLRTQLGALGSSIAFLAYTLCVSAFGSHVDANVVELCVAIAIISAAQFIRFTRRDVGAYVILAFIAALPTFWPWYLGWALLAAVASSRRAMLHYVVALCLCSFVIDLPFVGAPTYGTQATWILLFAAFALLFVCGLVPEALARPGSPGTIAGHLRRRFSTMPTLHTQ